VYQDRSVDVINITYHFFQEIDVLSLTPGSLPGGDLDLPVAVSGDFKQLYLWDREAGIPAAVSETFRISYAMNSGNRYTFRGQAEGRVIEADQWEKERVKEMIEEVLQDENLEDIAVSVSDDGVVLTLEDLLFYPDRAELLPGEEDKLADLSRIIRSFPAHDLLIRGHTAFVTHSDGQILSEERASSVAAYFLDNGVKSSSEMVVQGVGSQEPVSDNNSEEGRKRNRRVEITILDN
jgi:outer membrane protein OmpA-like peptidoglycan-associated protein